MNLFLIAALEKTVRLIKKEKVIKTPKGIFKISNLTIERQN